MRYDKLCELDITDLFKSVVGQSEEQPSNTNTCNIETPIQPDDNVGEPGNTPDIHIKVTEEGGIEIDSKDMAVKLSKVVFDAIKSLVQKGEE